METAPENLFDTCLQIPSCYPIAIGVICKVYWSQTSFTNRERPPSRQVLLYDALLIITQIWLKNPSWETKVPLQFIFNFVSSSPFMVFCDHEQDRNHGMFCVAYYLLPSMILIIFPERGDNPKV